MSQMSDLHIAAVRREQAQLAELQRKAAASKARHGHTNYVLLDAIRRTKDNLRALGQQAKEQS